MNGGAICDMVEIYDASEMGKVSCEICLKEIPDSEAKSRETSDYFAYFCGVDCYQEWGSATSTQR